MDSRGLLLGGAVLLLATTAGVSAFSGEGWVLPMSILLGVIFAILLFALMLKSGEERQGSTPTSITRNQSTSSQDNTGGNLPEPNDAGLDLPIL